MPTSPLSTPRSAAHRALYKSAPGKRVFICDDDLEFAVEIASALIASGFDVKTLKDGNSPVEIFELFRPDIIFVDIFMPPPDGFEVMNHISQDTRRKPLSVVLLSGADNALLTVAGRFCQARGIKPAAILQKPVRLSAVLELCKEHVRKNYDAQPGSAAS